jgi:hypothetical protein
MRRYLAFWITCTVTLVVVSLLAAFVAFRRVDLRYEAFVAIVVIPAVQALALAATTSRRGLRTIAASFGSAWRHPSIRAVLVLDVALIGLGLLADVGRSMPVLLAGISVRWMGVKLAVASVVFCESVFTGRPASHDSAWSLDRAWLLVISAALLALAAASVIAPVALAPDDLALRLWPRMPTVLRWSMVYATLFGGFLAIALRSSTALSKVSGASAALVETALGFVGLASMIVVLNIFLRPEVREPWSGLAIACGSFAATLILAAGLLARAQRTPASAEGTR